MFDEWDRTDWVLNILLAVMIIYLIVLPFLPMS